MVKYPENLAVENYRNANKYLKSVEDIVSKPEDIREADAQMAKVGVNAIDTANSVITYKNDIEDVSFGGSCAGPFFEALGTLADYFSEYAEDSQAVSDSLGMVANAYDACKDKNVYETTTSAGTAAGGHYIM